MTRRHGLWILGALLLVTGLARLRFDADVLHLLPRELPAVRALQWHQRHFPNARELWITIRADDPDSVTHTARALAEHLAARTNLVRGAHWQPPWQERPEDAAENLAWIWLQQPPEELARLANRLAPDHLGAELAAARQNLATALDPRELLRTSYDPLGLTRLPQSAGTGAGFESGTGLFVNEDGTFRVVFVEPARADLNYRDAADWLAEVRAQCALAVAKQPGGSLENVGVHFTGHPAFLAEISGGMERDLKNSVLATVLLIAALFWLAHRTWRPLGWLIVSLGLILVLTLALGGLFFGTLSVISVGFAAVLLGLAVDYGLVGYQEALATPGAAPADVRRETSRGVWYSAVTTAGTFLLLGFTGLPGLARLGQLTAVGLLVGAIVMLFFFLPRVCPVSPATTRELRAPAVPPGGTAGRTSWFPTLGVLGGIVLVFALRGWPGITATDDPLRPRSSAAYDAMDEARSKLGRAQEPLRLFFHGADVDAISHQLDRGHIALTDARQRGVAASFDLPRSFWPRPERATFNRALASQLAARAGELHAGALAAGFTPEALKLDANILAAWPRLAAMDASAWPTNVTARWLTGQFAAPTGDGGWLALGAVWPGSGFQGNPAELGIADDVLVGSWSHLAAALTGHVQRRVTVLTAGIAAVLTGCLWLAFRRWSEVALGLVALGLSLLLLLAVMSLAGWTWNLLSLVALPLLLGTSVDSTIHMQLALRRHRGDHVAVRRTTGKALLLCAGANIAGFSSLAWSSNLGLASLDVVCAVGVGCVCVVCVGLLPGWWTRFAGNVEAGPEPPERPPALYAAGIWRVGLVLARRLPLGPARILARAGAAVYRGVFPKRFAVVVDNLLPVVDANGAAAQRAARGNFRQFADKLVDVWRYEAGIPLGESIRQGSGWEHFQRAFRPNQGVLLVTLHLGNWEFGAPLLSRLGLRPLVLTAPEPGRGFTELRAQGRARQGVDTLAVGGNSFAFVEVIRRLQDGGLVALLMDRPPAATSVAVEFLGKPIRASVAAAELARATGCTVLPVYVVREGDGYGAHALPPVEYNRSALGDRAARIALTERILRAFEPVVRQFPDQWFHFVPVWAECRSAANGP